MEFKEFIQILYPIIGGSSSQGAFTKAIFDAIVTEEGQSAVDESAEVTYRSYFNGYTGISRIAKKISPYIETENFVSYVHEFSDETVLILCDSFREYLPEIDSFNAGRQLADLFLSILKTAAGTKRKSTLKGANSDKIILEDEPISEEIPRAEVVDDEMPSGAASELQGTTIIQHQTNVVQNGENNFNLTNNGTMNFNF